MAGAPSLTGAAGALIGVLDACLVNGFGSQTATSLVVASNVATLTLASAPAMEAGSVVNISGVTGALTALNADWVVTSATATTVVFATTGISDGTATGTITAKLSAAGWSKAFSGTNLAAYKSNSSSSPKHVLRVDDTGTTVARVVAYESMSDVNTGIAPFPTAAQMAGGLYWAKSAAAGATVRNWYVMCDDRTAYVIINPNTGLNSYIYGFGDFNSLKASDAFQTFICGHNADTSAAVAFTTAMGQGDLGYSNKTNQGIYVSRAVTGVGSSIPAIKQCLSHLGTAETYSGYGATLSPLSAFPNYADNAVQLSQVGIFPATNGLRGTFRGIYHSPQPLQDSFQSRDVFIPSSGPLSGRRVVTIRTGVPTLITASNYGVAFFDQTGTW